jgi:hypothetical protein
MLDISGISMEFLHYWQKLIQQMRLKFSAEFRQRILRGKILGRKSNT